jgi:exopolysaccharide production protein ExoY
MIKRVFDVFCSLLICLFGFPVFIFCILAVRFSSRGPVFYGHLRVGQGGKPFICLKFRTMVTDAEERLQQLLLVNSPILREWNTYYKLRSDPRVTPIGRWLRRFSLDELPQIWNVLKGEMSLVGPRPLTQHEVTHFLKNKAEKILSLKPGLTSIWIVRGHNQLTIKERIKWEEFYVDHCSFALDCHLIFQTAVAVVKCT